MDSNTTLTALQLVNVLVEDYEKYGAANLLLEVSDSNLFPYYAYLSKPHGIECPLYGIDEAAVSAVFALDTNEYERFDDDVFGENRIARLKSGQLETILIINSTAAPFSNYLRKATIDELIADLA